MTDVVSAEEFRTRLDGGHCVIRTGEAVYVGSLDADELSRCYFQHESMMVFPMDDSTETAAPPAEKRGKKHKKKKQKQDVTSAPEKEAAVQPVIEAPEVVVTATPLDTLTSFVPDAGAQVQALVGAAPADLKSILPDAGNTSGLTVIMAGIAVLGGGAAWKFYDSHSKRRHEQEMAKIERGDDTHKKCDASRAALELRVNDAQARLEAIHTRLDAIQQSLSEMRNAPKVEFDTGDLEERLEKLEKAAKKGRK